MKVEDAQQWSAGMLKADNRREHSSWDHSKVVVVAVAMAIGLLRAMVMVMLAMVMATAGVMITELVKRTKLRDTSHPRPDGFPHGVRPQRAAPPPRTWGICIGSQSESLMTDSAADDEGETGCTWFSLFLKPFDG